MSCKKCKGCQTAICQPGFYGNACNDTCSPTCQTIQCNVCACAVCNVTSGFCTNGCEHSSFGDTCNQTCPENCRQKNKFANACNRSTGICLNGCRNGFYGNICNSTCSRYCVNFTCEQKTGECSYGCVSGFSGSYCTDDNAQYTREIAGAVGGGFVVILWATIIVVLICFIWKRSLKGYEAYNRNTLLYETSVSSIKDSLRRPNSTSSVMNVSRNPPGVECLPRFSTENNEENYQTRLMEFRNVTFGEDLGNSRRSYSLSNMQESSFNYGAKLCSDSNIVRKLAEKREFHKHVTYDKNEKSVHKKYHSEEEIWELSKKH